MRETRYRDAMITQEQNKKVQTIVRETLAERFSSDEFVFNPIVVVPMVDEYGSDASGETYLRIIIVFDGDQKRLDSSWTSGFIRRIRPKLIEAGIEAFPSPSWVEKSEWWRLYPRWRHQHPEVNIETA